MFDEELAAPGEQVPQRELPLRCVEGVFLLHPHPGQLAPHPAELVTLTGVRLFALQQGHAGPEPLVAGDDGVRRLRSSRATHCDCSFAAGAPRDSTPPNPFAAALARSFHAAVAASPPADPTFAAVRTMIVRQAGHMAGPSLTIRGARRHEGGELALERLRRSRTPAFRHGAGRG